MGDDEVTVVLPPLEHATGSLRRLVAGLRRSGRVVAAALDVVEAGPESIEAVLALDEIWSDLFGLEQIIHGTRCAVGHLRDEHLARRGIRSDRRRPPATGDGGGGEGEDDGKG